MKNTVKERITTISNIVNEIKTMVSNPAGVNNQAYDAKRYQLNMVLVETLCGAEFTTNKKNETKIKFNKPLPSKKQVSEICTIVDDFIRNVENVYLEALEAAQVATDDDMGIPANGLRVNGVVPMITKAKNKELKNIFAGDNATILDIPLTAMDCITLAAMGEDARKDYNFKKTLIIGGVTVLVVGGVAAGIYIYNKKKDDDNVDVDVNVDIDDVNEINDDIPDTVDLDDMSMFSAD